MRLYLSILLSIISISIVSASIDILDIQSSGVGDNYGAIRLSLSDRVLKGEYKLEIPESNRSFFNSDAGKLYRDVFDDFNKNRLPAEKVSLIYLSE